MEQGIRHSRGLSEGDKEGEGPSAGCTGEDKTVLLGGNGATDTVGVSGLPGWALAVMISSALVAIIIISITLDCRSPPHTAAVTVGHQDLLHLPSRARVLEPLRCRGVVRVYPRVKQNQGQGPWRVSPVRRALHPYQWQRPLPCFEGRHYQR
jgi:hypothetical protein